MLHYNHPALEIEYPIECFKLHYTITVRQETELKSLLNFKIGKKRYCIFCWFIGILLVSFIGLLLVILYSPEQFSGH